MSLTPSHLRRAEPPGVPVGSSRRRRRRDHPSNTRGGEVDHGDRVGPTLPRYDAAVSEDDWIDMKAVARLLGLRESVVFVMVETGQLPAIRWPVRIRRSDVEGCIETARIKPGELAHLNPFSGGSRRTSA